MNSPDYPGWNSDPLGQALLAYLAGHLDARILTWSDLEGYDYLPASLLFRGIAEMPELEILALNQCRGRVLDLGAGAGSHALELQSRGYSVVALDHSAGAVSVMRKRGVSYVVKENLWHFQGAGFDTILALMNGSGLAGDLPGLELILKKAREWLAPGGKFLLDSADMSYLYDGSTVDRAENPEKGYYGETIYRMKFGDARSEAFGWLFTDFNTLARVAEKAGFTATQLFQGAEHEYLACLSVP